MALPNSFTKQNWYEVIDAFDNCCAYCGSDESIEQEHFVPVSLGGGYIRGNILPACRKCNREKLAKPPRQFVTSPTEYRKLLEMLCVA